jgi:hypothetical protein
LSRCWLLVWQRETEKHDYVQAWIIRHDYFFYPEI